MQEYGTKTLPGYDEELTLSGGQRLLIQRNGVEELLHIVSAHGGITLTIQMTEDGPVLRFEGANIKLEATGELAVEADRLALCGRSGVSVTSRGDVNIQTPGDLHSAARRQNITATRGNVNLRANDDVKLNGERVMVNC